MKQAEALVRLYAGIGHQLGDVLQPGLPSDESRRALERFLGKLRPAVRARYPESLPAALLNLYAWRNGTRWPKKAALGELSVVPGYRFVSFAEALAAWKRATDAVDESEAYENENTMFLGTSIFPFMEDGTGSHLVVEVAPKGKRLGSVGRFDDTGSFSVRGEFPSLDKFFRAHAECCKAGHYFLDDDGLLDEDSRSADKVRKKYRK